MRVDLIKLMLVDDHNLVREGIRRILEKEKEFKIIGEATDGLEAVKKAVRLNPDIILMDINMPNSNGLEALRKIKDLGIKCKVIILTTEAKKEYIIEANKIGAEAYLEKTITSSNLIKVIRNVNIGRTYLHPFLEEIKDDKSENNKTENLNLRKIGLLSKREYEILVLIASGYNNKEIGEGLYISEKTVKNHITNLFKKIEVSDRVQAVIFSYSNNITVIK